MKYTVEEIYNKLPSKWEDVSIAKFAKFGAIKISGPVYSENETTADVDIENLFVGADNTLKAISILADVLVEDLEDLPLVSILNLSKKIEFISEAPLPNRKCAIKWKSAAEMTYNDFILFQQFQKDFMNNLPLLIPAFAKTEISEEEAMNMNVVDAQTAFFFFKKHLKKSHRNMKFYLEAKKIEHKIKSWMKIPWKMK